MVVCKSDQLFRTTRHVFDQIRRAFFLFHLISIANESSEYQTWTRRNADKLSMYRILLVEDEDAVRRLLCAVLRSRRYDVIEARSGDTAVSLIESAAGRIDLLITDVIMPRMGGYELVQWARNFNPGIKVIYISGYLESDVVAQTRSDPNARFLQKPFLPTQMLMAVREVLGQRANETGG